MAWKKAALIGGIVGGVGVGLLIAKVSGFLVKFTFDCDREMVGCKWWKAWGTLKDWGGLTPIANQPIEIWADSPEPVCIATVETDSKGNYEYATFFELYDHVTESVTGTAQFWAQTTIKGKTYRTPEITVTGRIEACTGPCPSPTGAKFGNIIRQLLQARKTPQ